MGKKGASWFSAIKRVFTPHSKEKLTNQEQERKNGKEKKKKGFRKREPSSIEKILGEAERDHNLVFRPPSPLTDRSNPPSSSSPPLPLPRPTSPRVASPRTASPRPTSPRAASSRVELPRSLSPKLSDRSKTPPPPPLRPASPRVPSQRISTPIVPSPRPTSPRVASPQAIKPASPRGDLPRLDLPRPPSPKPPSPRGEPPRLDLPRPPSPKSDPPRSTTPKPPSPRTEPSRLDAPRPHSPRSTTPKPLPPKAEPSRLDAPRPSSPRPDPPRSPKPPSLRAEPSRLDATRSITPKPPSLRAEPSRLDAPRPPSPRAESSRVDALRPPSPKPPSPRAASPKAVQRREVVYRPEPTPLVQHASATKIQTAFRGYTARRSFRALKGLVRLQGVVRGYSVKRQTINAMKYMQQVVRVQTQIQSRRIKMLERQAQVEKDEAKTEAGNDDWDDSVLTKEERDARSKRKIDAIVKRERSMAYAYSHKLWKNSPKSAQGLRSPSGFPLWWNWMDRQLPLTSPAQSHSQPLRDYRQTPTRLSPSPMSQFSNNFDGSTPKSLRSTLLTPSRPFRTSTSRYSRGRYQDSPFFKDDDSLTSCPPFPSYMAPTVSAKAKVRPNSNPKERVMSANTTPRRMSYPPTQQQGLDTFRWNNKGSLLMSRGGSGSGSPGGVVLEKRKTLKSVGNMSIDSTVSTVGGSRKPFNRFV